MLPLLVASALANEPIAARFDVEPLRYDDALAANPGDEPVPEEATPRRKLSTGAVVALCVVGAVGTGFGTVGLVNVLFSHDYAMSGGGVE